MNYGRSRNGQNAVASGRGPASIVAGWIGGGITAGWIRQYVASGEWHHSQANLGGDGSPTDYYSRDDALAGWYGANLAAAKAGDRTARRRLPSLRAIRRRWAVDAGDVLDAMADGRPTREPEPEVDPRFPTGETVTVDRRILARQASRRQRYIESRETATLTVARVTAKFVIADDGRRFGLSTILDVRPADRTEVMACV